MDGKKEGIVNERLLTEIRAMNATEHYQVLMEIPLKTIMQYAIHKVSSLQNFVDKITNVVEAKPSEEIKMIPLD